MIEWHNQPNAPLPSMRLANAADIGEGVIRELVFGEGKDAFRVLLTRIDKEIKAYLNRCPHYGVPLNTEPGKFIRMSQRQVMCAIHCAVFKLENGECVDGPSKGDHLTEIDLAIDDEGEICIAETVGGTVPAAGYDRNRQS